jgi:hypothetical protein
VLATGGEIERDQFVPLLQVKMRHWCQRAQLRRIHDQRIQLAPAAADGIAQPVDGLIIRQIERRDGGAAAGLVDAIVQFLQAGFGAAGDDHVPAFAGEHFGSGRANAAAGPGNEGEFLVGVGHGLAQITRSASNESWSGTSTSS